MWYYYRPSASGCNLADGDIVSTEATVSVSQINTTGKVGGSSPVDVTVAVPPTVSITSPAAGSAVGGLVTVAAAASDNTGVSRVAFAVDGVLKMSDHTAPYEFVWDTTTEAVGPHTLVATAEDAAGLTTASAPTSVTVQGLGGGAALYDTVLKTPRCSGAASFCDSGTLLVGRASRGPEPNAPNTLAGACADGSIGSFHVDESNDRIRVSILDGTNLVVGKTVRIEAIVWAFSGFTGDKLDVFYRPARPRPSGRTSRPSRPPGPARRHSPPPTSSRREASRPSERSSATTASPPPAAQARTTTTTISSSTSSSV
jgi:hypothetical protein